MRRLTAFALFCILMLAVAAAFAGQVPADTKKQTTLGKYADAAEAYAMWKAEPAKVTLLDVRTVEEYVFVGHPDMARNIPVMFFSPKWNAEKKSYGMAPNPAFVEQVKAVLKPGDRILVMCRSGQRSAAAANMLAQAGFSDVWSVTDGFEGDTMSDKTSPDAGKRVVNGWKNASLPWTYALDPALIFAPAQ